MKNKILILLPVLFLLIFAFTPVYHPQKGTDWTVPEAAKKVKNPVKATPENIKAGKLLYDLHCKSCHGSKGKGDGTKAKSLNTECGDFSGKKFQDQTDGALFYKIREGRDEMPSYKKKIQDEAEVWSIVNYVRTLGSAAPAAEVKKPTPAEEKKPAPADVKKPEDKPVVKKDTVLHGKDSADRVERNAVMLLMQRYENAVNLSDTATLFSLFTPDIMYMPFKEATAVGTEQLKAALKGNLTMYKYAVKYTPDDIELDGDLALLRVTLKGTRTNLGIGDIHEESFENRALIVLKKVKGEWKICRLMSNQ